MNFLPRISVVLLLFTLLELFNNMEAIPLKRKLLGIDFTYSNNIPLYKIKANYSSTGDISYYRINYSSKLNNLQPFAAPNSTVFNKVITEKKLQNKENVTAVYSSDKLNKKIKFTTVEEFERRYFYELSNKSTESTQIDNLNSDQKNLKLQFNAKSKCYKVIPNKKTIFFLISLKLLISVINKF